MAISYSATQRRVIRQMVRRNTQGWGRPLAFTEQRLRLGGIMGFAALVILSAFLALNSSGRTLLSTVVGMVGIFLLVLFLGVWWYALPAFLRARSQPVEQVVGTVDAAICDVAEVFPFTRDPYHFVTVRQADGRLRAFAVDPQFHAQACQKGRRVTLTVTPGIEHVVAIA